MSKELLQHTQESLEFALQSGRMGTWDINLKNGTLSCSQEMLNLWNVSMEEFQGRRAILQRKVHPEDVDRMNLAINTAIENESIYELEYRILPSPGIQRWVMSRGRCTYEPNSKLPVRFSGVVFDITENKLKEEALAAAVKAREQFFMIASHELRTPLTCMQLQLQVMEWDLKHQYPEAFSKEKMEAGLRKQREQLQRITRIVDNILDESHISNGKLSMQLEQFDLTQMVVEVLERFRITAQTAGVEILFNTSEVISGKWDRFRIEQVLLNLLTNALRYGNKKPVVVEVKREGERAQLIVKDHGIGIQPADQSRIFNREERVISQNEVSGMGLGLFISNNIVQAHGGEIHLKSELGKGSEFKVILPCK